MFGYKVHVGGYTQKNSQVNEVNKFQHGEERKKEICLTSFDKIIMWREFFLCSS